MNLLFSLAVAALFGAGAYLMMRRDLIRLVVGTSMISNAVILYIVAASLTRGDAPIYPLEPGREVSDPVVQALALTALVITFGVSAFVLSLLYRIYTSHETLDQKRLAELDRKAAAGPRKGIGEEE